MQNQNRQNKYQKEEHYKNQNMKQMNKLQSTNMLNRLQLQKQVNVMMQNGKVQKGVVWAFDDTYNVLVLISVDLSARNALDTLSYLQEHSGSPNPDLNNMVIVNLSQVQSLNEQQVGAENLPAQARQPWRSIMAPNGEEFPHTTLPSIAPENQMTRKQDSDQFRNLFNLDLPLENNQLIQYFREKNFNVQWDADRIKFKNSETMVFKDFSGFFPDPVGKNVRDALQKFWDDNIPALFAAKYHNNNKIEKEIVTSNNVTKDDVKV